MKVVYSYLGKRYWVRFKVWETRLANTSDISNAIGIGSEMFIQGINVQVEAFV